MGVMKTHGGELYQPVTPYFTPMLITVDALKCLVAKHDTTLEIAFIFISFLVGMI